MSTEDADKAFRKLQFFANVEKNFHTFVKTLIFDDVEKWKSLYMFIDSVNDIDCTEDECSIIIKMAEEALQIDEIDSNFTFYILFSLDFAFSHVKNPFNYCINTKILPILVSLIDTDSSSSILLKICHIIHVICEELLMNRSNYGDNVLALQFTIQPLVFVIMQIDLDVMTSTVIECLKTTVDIFLLGDTTQKDICILFDLYKELIADEEESIQDRSLQCLSSLVSKYTNIVIHLFDESMILFLIDLLSNENANIVKNTATILAFLCSEKNLLELFLENGLPDKIFTTINQLLDKKLIAPIHPLLECFLALAETENSLIPLFFENDLFVQHKLVDSSSNINISILDIACSALEKFPDNPPFLNDLDQIVHIVSECLDMEDSDVLEDALTLLERLISEDVEIPNVQEQLEELMSNDDDEIASKAGLIFEQIQEKE